MERERKGEKTKKNTFSACQCGINLQFLESGSSSSTEKGSEKISLKCPKRLLINGGVGVV